MKKAMFPRAVAVILVAIAVAVLTLAGGGTSRAAHTPVEGDLLLDDGSIGGTNTATTLGTIQRQLCNVTLDSTVVIDVVAVDANDWLAMDFVVHYPSPAVVTIPGPGSTGEGGAFDFVPFSPNPAFPPTLPVFLNFGPQNFLIPDDASAPNAVYSTTEVVPDGSSPHGVSMFDASITNGDSGDGGMAKISLDTTGLLQGEYTLLLSKTSAFDGGVHSGPATPPPFPAPFNVDNYGAFMLAIDQACSTDGDLDGVSDADEATFGSDDSDHASIPESAAWLDGPTCTDGVDNDKDGFTDEKDIGCAPPPAPSFEKTMDLEAGSLPAGLEITTPVSTQWHELFPNFSQPWHLTGFDDVDGDSKLSPGDVIDMVHKGADETFGTADDGPPIFYVVEELTITVFLDEDGAKFEREFVCQPPPPPADQLCPNGDAATMAAAIADPLGTFWHEVAPNFSETWHLSSWTDDTSGDLSAGDTIEMTNIDTRVNKDYLVDDISMDILLTVIPEEGVFPLCGPGVDLSFAGLGLMNEVAGAPPPFNDGSGLLCHFSTTIDTPGSSATDDCVVDLPCNVNTLAVVERPPSTIQVPQPAERATLNPAVTILTGPTFDFAADADVTDGDTVGEVTVEVGSDAAIFGACSADLTLGPELLLDGTIVSGTHTGSPTGGNPADLFSPNHWPLQLEAEKAAVEAAFGGAATLVARYVSAFDVSAIVPGTDTPLNILVFEFNPLAGELIPGEGNGGWVTQWFTGDPIPEGGAVVPLPSTGATLCTSFSADTTVFGTSVGSSRMRTCNTAGTRTGAADIEPDVLNGTDTDVGTRIDVSTCTYHDAAVLHLNRPSSGLKMKPGELVSKPFLVQIQNQSDHTDDIRVRMKVINPDPVNCSVNGQFVTELVTMDLVSTLNPGFKDTFSGTQTSIDFQCSVVPDGESFSVKVDLDHGNDGDPFGLDDDDSDPSDNTREKALIVQLQ